MRVSDPDGKIKTKNANSIFSHIQTNTFSYPGKCTFIHPQTRGYTHFYVSKRIYTTAYGNIYIYIHIYIYKYLYNIRVL